MFTGFMVGVVLMVLAVFLIAVLMNYRHQLKEQEMHELKQVIESTASDAISPMIIETNIQIMERSLDLMSEKMPEMMKTTYEAIKKMEEEHMKDYEVDVKAVDWN